MDVVNGTGDPAVADEVAAHLTAAGLTVGTVIAGEPAASGVEHPAGWALPAEWLGAAPLFRQGDVAHVTVVLAAADAATLVTAVESLPACG